MIKASKLGKKIGVIGYGNLIRGLDLLNPLLNINIKQVFADNENEMRNQILKLKSEGIDVIVGGIFQTNTAKELDMNYVRIDLSEKALEYAYNEAKSILHTIISNIRTNEELKAILDHTKEGYVAVDKQGIYLINKRAQKLIPDYIKAVDTPLEKVFRN